jgi:anti-sigma factor RsiW
LPCERTRAWISVAQDSELSEFERALVASHLERCPECSAFSADVSAITTSLRTSPLQSPANPITLPALRRRPRVSALRIGAAAAVVVGALGLAGSLSLTLPSDTNRQFPALEPATAEGESDLRSVRRNEFLPGTSPLDLSRKSLGLQ